MVQFLKNMSVYSFLILFTISTIFAQEFEITVFTKADCGKCLGTKTFFEENNITFNDCPLSNKECDDKMWLYLKNIQVGTSVTPVILVNGFVVFPVFEEGEIQHITHEEFLPKFLEFIEIGRVLPYSYGGQDIMKLYEGEENVLTVDQPQGFRNLEGNFYVIAGSFKNKQNALWLKSTLVKEGFINVEIKQYKKLYRTACGKFNSLDDLIVFTQKISANYPDFWILFEDSKTQEVMVINNLGGDFRVIVGSFTSLQKAEIHIEYLKTRGLTNCTVHISKDKYRVSAGNFEGFRQAHDFMKFLPPGVEGWLLME